MKRLVAIAALVITGIIMFLAMRVTHAAQAPLPDTLSASGYGPYESGLIQPKQSPWYITLDATPLNDSMSVTILNQSRHVVDYKLVPSAVAGRVIYTGQGTAPMYVENYAGNWTMNLSY